MTSVGLDGVGWLSTSSSSDRLILMALAQRLQSLERRRNSDLATAIINKLGEAMR
jgi:hypothetical protein